MSNPKEQRERITAMAASYLSDIMDGDEGRKAAGRIGLSYAAAARAARDPSALFRCSPASIAAAVAMSALTELYPGGPMPVCWLVPRGGELQWMISHRGLCELSARAGINLRAIPVNRSDDLEVSGGDVVHHVSDPDAWPSSLDDLRGVYVRIQRAADGLVLGQPWLPAKAIQQRAQAQGSGPVWRKWPVEMAQKTAIKWAVARGYVQISGDPMRHAIEADRAAEQPQAPAITDRRAAQAAALGIDIEPEQPALPDYGEPQTMTIEAREGARVGEE